MRTDRYLKEKGRPGRQSGYTLMEVLTVLIIAGILATVAFHSYRQYKETALFDSYRYNMVLGVNTAKQAAKTGSHKARLCAGFSGMVDVLKEGKTLNTDEQTCNVTGADWKYGWYTVEAMAVKEGDDIVFTPMVTSINEIGGRYPVTLTGGGKRTLTGGGKRIDFMSNGRVIPYNTDAEHLVLAAKHDGFRMCKFVLIQRVGDVQSGECKIGSCAESAAKACGNSDSSCKNAIKSACGR